MIVMIVQSLIGHLYPFDTQSIPWVPSRILDCLLFVVSDIGDCAPVYTYIYILYIYIIYIIFQLQLQQAIVNDKNRDSIIQDSVASYIWFHTEMTRHRAKTVIES